MKSKCYRLHKCFNSLPRYIFPFDEKQLPKNGIYVLFEKDEMYFDFERVVRVGTHTGDGNLRQRLKEHFFKENKDRSIFRKNIGRALLNKRKDSFLSFWDLDLTSHENREKYSSKIDFEKQKEIENEVSKIIRKNFSFSIIPIETKIKTKDERLHYEEGIISTLVHDPDFCQSKNWLGNFSTKIKIRQSGMWLEKGLNAPELTDEEVDFIIQICKSDMEKLHDK